MNQKMMQLLMSKENAGGNQGNLNHQALNQEHLVKTHFIEPTKGHATQASQKLNCQTFQVSNQYSCKGSTSFFHEQEAEQDAEEMAQHHGTQGAAMKQQTPSAVKQRSIKLQGASNGGIVIKDQQLQMNSFLKQNKIKTKNTNQEVSVGSSKPTQSKTKTSQDQSHKLKQASIVSSSFDKSGKSSNISKYKNGAQVNSSQGGSITFNNKDLMSM